MMKFILIYTTPVYVLRDALKLKTKRRAKYKRIHSRGSRSGDARHIIYCPEHGDFSRQYFCIAVIIRTGRAVGSAASAAGGLYHPPPRGVHGFPAKLASRSHNGTPHSTPLRRMCVCVLTFTYTLNTFIHVYYNMV